MFIFHHCDEQTMSGTVAPVVERRQFVDRMVKAVESVGNRSTRHLMETVDLCHVQATRLHNTEVASRIARGGVCICGNAKASEDIQCTFMQESSHILSYTNEVMYHFSKHGRSVSDVELEYTSMDTEYSVDMISLYTAALKALLTSPAPMEDIIREMKRLTVTFQVVCVPESNRDYMGLCVQVHSFMDRMRKLEARMAGCTTESPVTDDATAQGDAASADAEEVHWAFSAKGAQEESPPA